MANVKTIYSMCGMCTVRCPIAVEVKDGSIKHIWGNPHLLGGFNLCARGAAGKAFEYDDERPQYPMLRVGNRGSGQWKRVSWQEALDYIATRLNEIKHQYGPQAICLSDRGGPHTDFQKTFIASIGSPNYFNHHASCSNSVHNAHISIAGHARNTVSYDYKHCKYLVLYGRNLFESLGTTEAKDVIDMIAAGGRMIYIDVRYNYTAAKAARFFLIRPATDYALNLALINVIVNEGLYDRDFVARWVIGLDELKRFVAPYTPQWAQGETEINAAEITTMAYEAAKASPAVLFHPGWMTAWGSNDFYLRRTIYTLNALLGNYEARGGIIINKTPADVGVRLKSLLAEVPRPVGERFDGCGTIHKHLGAQWGLGQLLPEAILGETPYPIKAYIAMRHDPLASMPDPEAFKTALDRLDLLVSIDVNYSETAWYSDCILPECTFLERTDHVIAQNGLKPRLLLRRQAVKPRFDSRPRWYIFRELAHKMGVGQYFPYDSIEELIAWQLEGTGFTIEDFDHTGCIELSDQPLWFDRANGLRFNTPSGRLEIISPTLEGASIASFIPFERAEAIPAGLFRLVTSKVAVHTQGRTTSNIAILNELVAESRLWINTGRARELGVADGDEVEVSVEGFSRRITARLTDLIHVEVVFMLHGFGDSVAVRTRSFNRGVSDVRLQKGLLKLTVGGNCPLTECFVAVRPVKKE
ncbi:MAG: molybdopterin-dependent oxidoreductase [Nitrospirae bacterium]|nr:molybdopterin-dependent oxidoreductase [Nitrospirota bacterium]